MKRKHNGLDSVIYSNLSPATLTTIVRKIIKVHNKYARNNKSIKKYQRELKSLNLCRYTMKKGIC